MTQARSKEWKKAHSRRATAQRAERSTTLVSRAYWGSDGALTLQAFAALLACGYNGELACLLFRAMKASTRAKVYRGGNGKDSYRKLSYDRKGESLALLCEFLTGCSADCWGWKMDHSAQHNNRWVLYVELPNGQVSFHSEKRYSGPEFKGEWNRDSHSEESVVTFCEEVIADESPEQKAADDAAQAARLDSADFRYV